jgi:anti-anti-sigma factor
MDEPSIYFWNSDGCGWARVVGDANFLNATQLKEFGREVVDKGAREFVVDLKDCQQLDSTFMGTIAGIALRIRELYGPRGGVHVVNCSDGHKRLLAALGLHQVFKVNDKDW